MAAQARSLSLFDPSILGPAVGEAFKKLNPATLWRNPVMFVVEIVSAATTILRDRFSAHETVQFDLRFARKRLHCVYTTC